jgi:hypothetical protein
MSRLHLDQRPVHDAHDPPSSEHVAFFSTSMTKVQQQTFFRQACDSLAWSAGSFSRLSIRFLFSLWSPKARESIESPFSGVIFAAYPQTRHLF